MFDSSGSSRYGMSLSFYAIQTETTRYRVAASAAVARVSKALKNALL